MALRCLLFSSDTATAEPICQVLAGLGVEGESCSDGVVAVEKVTQQAFQIVIIDWGMQPEAGLLLTTARERKAAERPLTLAIVSDDASVPQALHAGANSILRKPILVNQVKDTLTTARDLLRSKQESATQAARTVAAAASGGAASLPSSSVERSENTLRPAEFLQSTAPSPGGQFVTESDVHDSVERAIAAQVDSLKGLEPTAAAMAPAADQEKPAPPPVPSEPRGLEWYLKGRAGALPTVAGDSAPPKPAKPELLGFDQLASEPPPPSPPSSKAAVRVPPVEAKPIPPEQHAQKEEEKEAKLFAYMDGGAVESEERVRPSFGLGKKAIIGALVLAGCAIAAAPQAPWHPAIQGAWRRGEHAIHGWLNPQPVTTAPAPAAHESFGRAGDEYKMPVPENIPDATTDPSQIRVLPVIDPTAKKPTNTDGTNADPVAGPADPTGTSPVDPATPSGEPNQPTDSTPQTVQPGSSEPVATAPSSPNAPITAPAIQPRPEPSAVSSPSVSSVPAKPAAPKNSPPHSASAPANVPSSLKSQIASMTPEASGNKPIESAMPSIEPVAVPEITERALLIEQPSPAYPANARGQQGTVVLQVLIGRDGAVQDAKFLQGSLAFARAAIDGVKLWKFKPYTMNGRPVSVQTLLTMNFKP